jgi:hypothetical protein
MIDKRGTRWYDTNRCRENGSHKENLENSKDLKNSKKYKKLLTNQNRCDILSKLSRKRQQRNEH